MAEKYYAVRKGRDGARLYLSWDECRAAVNGYPGAVFKSFREKKDAEDFLGFGCTTEAIESADVFAYTDGSFSDRSNSGFAAILMEGKPGAARWVAAIYGPCGKSVEIRNIGGEIEAAEWAVREAARRGYRHIAVYHDYEGVGKWADGLWKANKPDTIAYVKQMAELRQTIKVSFVKVKGHNGDPYNELADEYAKAGADEQEVRVTSLD